MMIKFVTGMKIKRANIMFLNLDNSVLEGYNSEKKNYNCSKILFTAWMPFWEER